MRSFDVSPPRKFVEKMCALNYLLSQSVLVKYESCSPGEEKVEQIITQTDFQLLVNCTFLRPIREILPVLYNSATEPTRPGTR